MMIMRQTYETAAAAAVLDSYRGEAAFLLPPIGEAAFLFKRIL